MSGSFFSEPEGKSKNTPFFMKRSIGRDYREAMETMLASLGSYDDYRYVITNFDNATVKMAFLKAL